MENKSINLKKEIKNVNFTSQFCLRSMSNKLTMLNQKKYL